MPLSQKVNELVLLAKSAKKESEFQQLYKYKKFKEKTVDKKAISEIADLVDELYLLQFYEECIFWGNKFVEDSRVRDSGERLNAFSILFTSYFQTNNFEKAIECGQIVYQYQMNDFKGKELCRSIFILLGEKHSCLMSNGDKKNNCVPCVLVYFFILSKVDGH